MSVFPYDSPTTRIGTWESTYIKPTIGLVLAISFVIGICDGLYQTQGNIFYKLR